jgi:hypothetical protein
LAQSSHVCGPQNRLSRSDSTSSSTASICSSLRSGRACRSTSDATSLSISPRSSLFSSLQCALSRAQRRLAFRSVCSTQCCKHSELFALTGPPVDGDDIATALGNSWERHLPIPARALLRFLGARFMGADRCATRRVTTNGNGSGTCCLAVRVQSVRPQVTTCGFAEAALCRYRSGRSLARLAGPDRGVLSEFAPTTSERAVCS